MFQPCPLAPFLYTWALYGLFKNFHLWRHRTPMSWPFVRLQTCCLLCDPATSLTTLLFHTFNCSQTHVTTHVFVSSIPPSCHDYICDVLQAHVCSCVWLLTAQFVSLPQTCDLRAILTKLWLCGFSHKLHTHSDKTASLSRLNGVCELDSARHPMQV